MQHLMKCLSMLLLAGSLGACTETPATSTDEAALTELEGPVIDGTLVGPDGYTPDPCSYVPNPETCDPDSAVRSKCVTGTKYVKQCRNCAKVVLWCKIKSCPLNIGGIELPPSTSQNGCVQCARGANPNTGSRCTQITPTTPD